MLKTSLISLTLAASLCGVTWAEPGQNADRPTAPERTLKSGKTQSVTAEKELRQRRAAVRSAWVARRESELPDGNGPAQELPARKMSEQERQELRQQLRQQSRDHVAPKKGP